MCRRGHDMSSAEHVAATLSRAHSLADRRVDMIHGCDAEEKQTRYELSVHTHCADEFIL